MEHVGLAPTLIISLQYLCFKYSKALIKIQYALDFYEPSNSHSAKTGSLLDTIYIIYRRIGLDTSTDGDCMLKYSSRCLDHSHKDQSMLIRLLLIWRWLWLRWPWGMVWSKYWSII